MSPKTSETFDFLVIGSGLAGLTYALRVAEFGSVCILTKAQVTDSNTSYAQGGIAAAIGEADSWELHEEDTLAAGTGLCNRDAVRFLVQEAPGAIQWLIDLGARFDSAQGDLLLGREGGHSRNRIVHHVDKTGWEVERVVSEQIRKHPNITVYEHAFVTSLVTVGDVCVGAEAKIETLGMRSFRARATMLATGGCGRVYLHTTNPTVATGDGLGLCLGVGLQLANMEFMQFHPTTLYHPQFRSFLISEAVRGAGATLRNHLGRRFMYDYDPALELAPRDIVSRAIEQEMKKRSTWCVYLDTTHISRELLSTSFPTIYKTLAGIGLEMEKDWIPVVPAQHYSCGGVPTDLNGQTALKGLYAAGEVASTGVHGANRLASNSLLEALVFAAAAADHSKQAQAIPAGKESKSMPKAISESESVRIRKAMQHVMTEEVGVMRTSAGLSHASERIAALIEEYNASPAAHDSNHPLETYNMLHVAQSIVHAAQARIENVGLHYNLDLVPGTFDAPARL